MTKPETPDSSRLQGSLVPGPNRLRGHLLGVAEVDLADDTGAAPFERYLNRDSGVVYTVVHETTKEDGDSLLQLRSDGGEYTFNTRRSRMNGILSEEGTAWSRFVPPEAVE